MTRVSSRFELAAYLRAIRADETLSPNARLAACILASYADFQSGHARPGLDRLAAGMGKKRSMATKGVMELRDNAWLEVVKRGRKGVASVYRLRTPDVADVTQPSEYSPSLGFGQKPQGGAQPVGLDVESHVWGHVQPILTMIRERLPAETQADVLEAWDSFRMKADLCRILFELTGGHGVEARHSPSGIASVLTEVSLTGTREPLAVIYARAQRVERGEGAVPPGARGVSA